MFIQSDLAKKLASLAKSDVNTPVAIVTLFNCLGKARVIV